MMLSKGLLAVLPAVLGMAAAQALGSSLTLTGAAGEYENDYDTERYTIEARLDAPADFHFTIRGEKNRHPLNEIGDRVFVGGGYSLCGWRLELVGDDERYLATAMYTAPTDTWVLRGGVQHANRWRHGFKQTGLKVSAGYPVLPNVTAGGFYEIGNTTMRSVDDLYGGYLKWSF